MEALIPPPSLFLIFISDPMELVDGRFWWRQRRSLPSNPRASLRHTQATAATTKLAAGGSRSALPPPANTFPSSVWYYGCPPGVVVQILLVQSMCGLSVRLWACRPVLPVVKTTGWCAHLILLFVRNLVVVSILALGALSVILITVIADSDLRCAGGWLLPCATSSTLCGLWEGCWWGRYPRLVESTVVTVGDPFSWPRSPSWISKVRRWLGLASF